MRIEEDQLRAAFLLTVGLCAVSGFLAGALTVILFVH